ncbi:SDR family oxidoreductase [Bradyrhizobium sp. 62B]|jgi:3-oxoacyl-[acyl-carrier protein] reductase|uniref:SDR family oxidoreductase n=1 Tax=Bradyrhizobium TaxID=374 RepID=UPI001BA6DA92|nr:MULTISPECIES: SDR family oxidoreductase [Bradyrhizobium]WIW43578.1 SDR family oxidoreductase [Bradyrhizobium sp. 62B]MBR0927204.1 SDR family oxidoreductase [Bradyrhizobium diazoefficiens]MCS3759085.1 3-oxoacyl-[acyl-carrier protein] reductase [Bradyrhizobium centrosematis]MCS3773026.1 3-oxoacyl-[acyl-carrier protein] reductase [Bradyrhizobium centrosematis]MDT4741473.1 SDR family oxidoreductase [Bradyrhizobium sp. WYCCWR 12699]
MTHQLQRAAVVTGGSRGIGAAIVRRLVRDGIAVAINYASGRSAADALVAEIESAGGRAIAVQADLADPATPARLFDAAERAFGGVDVLVNNAGVMELGPLAEMTDEAFTRQMSVNLDSVFRSMREAARRLRDGGRIVSFSSSVVGLYQPGYGVYAATKAAVEAMTHVLAKELGGRRITVNAVAPGPVETRLFLEGKSEQQVRAIAAMNPFGRLGQPDDIAGLVAFLAGNDSAWVNGQVIRANGGVI